MFKALEALGRPLKELVGAMVRVGCVAEAGERPPLFFEGLAGGVLSRAGCAMDAETCRCNACLARCEARRAASKSP